MPAPTFPYVTTDGRQLDVELIVSVDDLDIDAADALEQLIGADIRKINDLRLVQQLRVFVFISVRRVDPAATIEYVGRVKLGPLLGAFTEAVNANNAARAALRAVQSGADPAEALAAAQAALDGAAAPSAPPQPDLRLVTRPDVDPLTSEPGTGAQDSPAGGRDVSFTANVVIPTTIATPAPDEPGEVLSPTNADSED